MAAEDDNTQWNHCPECQRVFSLESTTETPSNQTGRSSWKIAGFALRGEVTIPLYSLIFLLAIVGNLLVIIVLVQNKRMRTVTNVFLVNLSVSDLLLAVFCMPFTLIPTLMQDFVFGMAMCVLIRYMQGVSVGVCVFTLVAISLERYFAICQPLRSRVWQTMTHSYRTIGFIWGLSLALMLPTAVFQRLLELQNGAHKCVEVWEDRTFEKFYTVLLDLVLLVVPLVMMLCAYGLIAVTLFKGLRLTAHAQRQAPELLRSLPAEETDETDDDTVRYVSTAVHNAPRHHHHHHHQSTRRWLRRPRNSVVGAGGIVGGPNRTAALRPNRSADLSVSTVRARRRSVKMLFAVVLEFFLCWTPMYVMQTWLIFDRAGAVRSISAMAMNLVHLLAFVSSCCNPITYCFMSKRFRQSFLSVVYNTCCPSSRKRDSDLYLRCRCSHHLRSRTWQSGCSMHRAVSNHRTTEF